MQQSLSELNFEENHTKWVWEGFLAKCCITLMSAWPKTGKTTLLTHFLKAQDQMNSSFLGFDLKSTKTLVISEEHPNIWYARREAFVFSGKRVLITKNVLTHRLTNNEWQNYLQQIAGYCQENSIEVVVFDTLSSFWPVAEENSAASVMEALKPLRHLTENDLAVLLVHHERKSGGENGVEARGSGAIAAFVDILVNLKRPPSGGSPHTRIISTNSRFAETPEKLFIELHDGEYIVREGLPEKFVDFIAKGLESIPFVPASISQAELATQLTNSGYELSPATLWRHLNKAKGKGLVCILGKAPTRGNPTLWARTAPEIEEKESP